MEIAYAIKKRLGKRKRKGGKPASLKLCVGLNSRVWRKTYFSTTWSNLARRSRFLSYVGNKRKNVGLTNEPYKRVCMLAAYFFRPNFARFIAPQSYFSRTHSTASSNRKCFLPLERTNVCTKLACRFSCNITAHFVRLHLSLSLDSHLLPLRDCCCCCRRRWCGHFRCHARLSSEREQYNAWEIGENRAIIRLTCGTLAGKIKSEFCGTF